MRSIRVGLTDFGQRLTGLRQCQRRYRYEIRIADEGNETFDADSRLAPDLLLLVNENSGSFLGVSTLLLW